MENSGDHFNAVGQSGQYLRLRMYLSAEYEYRIQWIKKSGQYINLLWANLNSARIWFPQ